MKCSGSPTICIAADPAMRERAVRIFEALLFEQTLKPLAKPLGPIGEIALSSVAEKIFVPPSRKAT